ncbi:MAG: phenylalanine--tRNA ligase subunit beta [Prochlorothrix sp.]
MRISLNWLRTLVATTLDAEDLGHRLTMAGFEVEEIEDRSAWAAGVVVGKVLDRQPHPNADRLSVCQVDIGAEDPVTIVCGAPNVRSDIYVAVATLGSYLPVIDLKLKKTKLRGVKSEGMICSLAEVGLRKESEGIHIFDPAIVGSDALIPGADARPLLGLDDIVLDLSSTANRADALSLIGIAREVRALTGVPLTLPAVTVATDFPQTPALEIGLEAAKACPLYIGTLIEGVTIGPSPAWLRQRLEASGIRPINNVVDITNYVLLEWGQPLHAFDRDRLQQITGHETLTVGVRFAKAGETLTTLDSQARTLQDQNLVITAQDHPVALAGVMGGESSEVHGGTRNLLVEAAWFDSVAIRRSARAQGLRTEASTRYERGVNMVELPQACQRAIDLILEIAGGTVTSQSWGDRRPDTQSTPIELRLERVQQVLGTVEAGEDSERLLEAADVEKTLTALGCQLSPLSESGTWAVTVPPYRYRDLEREIDLIEEVARLYGYDNFCDTLPSEGELGYLPEDQVWTRRVREACRAVGLTELMHYSLVKPDQSRQITLANPLFAEYSALRTDLVPGLLDAFLYNWEQGNGGLLGFEIGRIFWSDEEGLGESDCLGGVLGGDPSQSHWRSSGREQPLDWYEAKGYLESIFQRLGVTVEYHPDRQDQRLHPGRTASLWISDDGRRPAIGHRLGTFGQLHPQLAQERGLTVPVYLFQWDLDVLLDALMKQADTGIHFQPFSTFPAADRDLAFFVPTAVAVADLEKAMAKAGGTLLQEITLFDQYQGEPVPEGQRSLAFRLVYRADDRTLTDAEVDPVHQKIRDALLEKFQVTLRS